MLTGKVAVVTGASRGIGRAIAIEMAAAGADVAILCTSKGKAAEETEQAVKNHGRKANIYPCDIGNFQEVKTVFEQIVSDFGQIDILVNNAGIVRDGLFLSMSEEDFDQVIQTNLKGVFNTTKQVYPLMMRKRAGRIINISSIIGLMGNAGQANYAASKAGIIGLTKSIARELGARNVTCNAIAPGFIETEMTGTLPEKVVQAAINQIPSKRMGQAEDIAHLAVFLASDKSAYITGEVFKVDGGLYT